MLRIQWRIQDSKEGGASGQTRYEKWGRGGGCGSLQAQYEKWGFYAKRHAVFTLSLTNGCNFGRGGAQAPGALSLGMRLRKP